MNVPPYDPIRLEFKGKSELNGKQVRVNVFVVCKCIIININEHHDYNIIYILTLMRKIKVHYPHITDH